MSLAGPTPAVRWSVLRRSTRSIDAAEAHVVGGGARRPEGDGAAALGFHRGRRGAGEPPVLDDDGGPAVRPVVLGVPDGRAPRRRRAPRPCTGRRAPAKRRSSSAPNRRAVGVRQQHVVVLGQEAHRRRRVGIGPRRVGQVEQLAAALVAERRAAAAAAARTPRRMPVSRDHAVDVGGRRRAEGGEVAEHDLVDRRWSTPAVAPTHDVERRRASPARGLPHTPRGGTCTSGQQAAAGVGQRRRRAGRGTARPAPPGARRR